MNRTLDDYINKPIELIKEAELLSESAKRKKAKAVELLSRAAECYINKGESMQDKMILASHLYWNVIEIAPSMICSVFGIKSLSKKGYELVTSNPPIRDLKCISCDEMVRVPVNSRKHLEEISKGGGSKFCDHCKSNQERLWQEQHKEALDQVINSPIISVVRDGNLDAMPRAELVREGSKVLIAAGGLSNMPFELDIRDYEKISYLAQYSELHNFVPNDFEAMIIKDKLIELERVLCPNQ